MRFSHRRLQKSAPGRHTQETSCRSVAPPVGRSACSLFSSLSLSFLSCCRSVVLAATAKVTDGSLGTTKGPAGRHDVLPVTGEDVRGERRHISASVFIHFHLSVMCFSDVVPSPSSRCISCHGQGFKTCSVCHGSQNLLHYIQLTVTWCARDTHRYTDT